MAYVYPAEMRATRDLLRRRNHLTRKRADLLSHIQNTNSQYNMEPFAENIAYKKNRDDIAEQFIDPDVRMSIEADLELIDSARHAEAEDSSCTSCATPRTTTPRPSTACARSRASDRSSPWSILYEIGDIDRFPRVQDFASYARLVKCAKESAGKRYGSTGAKIGNAHLKWAFSEAAVLFLRNNPEGMKFKQAAREEARQGQVSLDPGPQARPGRLLHAQTGPGLRSCSAS